MCIVDTNGSVWKSVGVPIVGFSRLFFCSLVHCRLQYLFYRVKGKDSEQKKNFNDDRLHLLLCSDVVVICDFDLIAGDLGVVVVRVFTVVQCCARGDNESS